MRGSPGLALALDLLAVVMAFSFPFDRWWRVRDFFEGRSGGFRRSHCRPLGWGLVLSALFLGGCGFFGGKKVELKVPEESVIVRVTITAKRYSFTPNLIRVKQGQALEIKLVSEDVPHGFGIRRPGRIRNFGSFEPGQPITVVVRTDTKGVIEFFSTVYSGVDYNDMQGKILVE